jgi:CHAT domain-containing protein
MNILMNSFYNYLRGTKNRTKKLGKAEALINAQRDLIGQAIFHHPFYWASTITIGDWR